MDQPAGWPISLSIAERGPIDGCCLIDGGLILDRARREQDMQAGGQAGARRTITMYSKVRGASLARCIWLDRYVCRLLGRPAGLI